MKVGNVDINTRAVVVASKNKELLGSIGYVLLPNSYKQSVAMLLDEKTLNRIAIAPTDVLVEIPEDSGMVFAGTSNIPINERVKIISSGNTALVGAIGYITHPFSRLAKSGEEYIAGIYVESSKALIETEYNLQKSDKFIRYPVS